MRFLLDEGLSPRVADLLAAAGHDVVHVRDIDLKSAPDPIILLRAVEDRRVLVILDTDFSALVTHSHATVGSRGHRPPAGGPCLPVRGGRQRRRRGGRVTALAPAR